MVSLRKGDYVWVDTGSGVPIGARVKHTDGKQLSLINDDGKEVYMSTSEQASLKLMHPTSVEGVDDMIRLGDLTEAGVLRNLLIRHKRDIIYTYIGSVLVAVNPYQVLPIYTADQVRLYHGRRLGELPPHVFAIADCCYYNMMRNQCNQCCIISGESGAGKTESTKLMLQFLAAVSGQHSWIEQQILQANPVLEAFGNAKTIRNDNSSRFGKYIEIHFNKDGVIEGAHMEQYLLEKSRVCHQASMERNYHIFYCMLSGMEKEQKKVLLLDDATKFHYLTEGKCTKCEGRDDLEEFSRIRTALKVLTFTEKECWDIFKLLAAILHLGNICFEAGTSGNMESCGVATSDHFTVTAKLLEIDPTSLSASLTSRTFITNKERVTKPLSSEQAVDCRDALAKAIYSRLFVWIFGKINSAIYKPKPNAASTQKSIGLLDIFGFENFIRNSFEQLCINYANEQLQQLFVQHIFKMEQEEYLKEGIKWKNLSFTDNKGTLNLLALKPLNVLALIDEESLFPKGTDATMLNKMNQSHKKNNFYISPKGSHSLVFGIKHFAGTVYYDCHGFLEKNRDSLSLDIIMLVQKSSSKLLGQMFEKELSASVPVKNNNHKIMITPKSTLRGNDARKQITTLSGQFRQSLDTLMKALSLCQPFFIRCFKPNDSKQSMNFDRDLCMQQLHYSGLLDTIKIRKSGYPIQHKFGEFLGRYRVLLKTTDCDPNKEPASNCCNAICRAIIKQQDDWRIGTTKIFLRDYHDSFLELERERELNRKALIIQRVMLGHRDRRNFLKKRSSAVTVQKCWRGYKGRKGFLKMRHGLMRLQAKVRSRKILQHYKDQRAAAIKIQRCTRKYLARKNLKRKRQAAILLQTQTRGFLARKKLKQLRNNALLLAQAQQEGEFTARELQQRLQEVFDQAQEANHKQEDSSDEDSVKNSFSLVPNDTDKPKPRLSSTQEEPKAEQKKVEVSRKTVQIVVTPTQEDKSDKSDKSDEEEEEKEDNEDDEFSFSKLSVTHFQRSATHTHIKQRLKHPLLYHEDEGDTLASLTVWWIILRYMGDIPEPRMARMSMTADLIQQNLGQRQGRRLSSLVGLDQKILRKKQKQQKQDLRKRRHSAIPEEVTSDGMTLVEDEDILIGEGPSFDRPMTPLEKLHIIMGYGLARPGIRDEIYCQICKQLTKNKDKNSRHRGWVLLSICLGIFPPTDLLKNYLERFVRRGPGQFSSSCAERLRRTLANGERKEVACCLEINAVEKHEPLKVEVTLRNGQVITVPLDSASTSEEICRNIAKEIKLIDTFGFSVYISYYDKDWSLGSSRVHVLDAICQCEQEEKRQGREELGAPWSLSFRKELFTPWHDCSIDHVSTDLIYAQVVHDLKLGEYQCEKEDDYVQLAAKHYYIKHGTESKTEYAKSIVWECMNITMIESKSEAKLVQLVSSAHSQGPYIKSRMSANAVKAEVVGYARLRWPIYFSKFFEATMISGPPLPQEKFVIAVNWREVSIQEGKERTLLQLSYAEITNVEILSDSRMGDVVGISTLRGEYKLQVLKGSSMVELLSMFLNGLKERSLYAIAVLDTSRHDDTTLLNCKRGDLIHIIKDGEFSAEGGWIKGKNERTSQNGAISTENIMILSILNRPDDDLLALLNPNQRTSVLHNAVKEEMNMERVALVSLKEFSYEYFREPGKEPGRPGKPATKEKLWARTKEPLRQPLMLSLQKDSELCQLACNSFTAIMKYMGDYPIKNQRNPVELTDQIFGPPLQQPNLRDEIYCQIMKQLTNNNNGISLERGWQLLWFCCGLFAPSKALLKHAQRFLESRARDPLSAACLQRMQGMLSIEARTLPPHQVEVDAIQQNSSQIFHKVHFPNETSEIFEIHTTLRIRDMCRNIANHLMLSSADGYCLFVKTANKVVSMDEQQYFFDNLKQLTETTKKGKKEKAKEGNPTTAPYLVLFMRKLWFNVFPGKDLTADLMFHFPQELPKYLRGYHNATKEEMISLAGLLFRVRVDTDRSQFVMIPKMLKDLIPADQHKIMSNEEWKKNIINAYNKQAGITVDEAKIQFLKEIFRWPTFGCVFFEVKQTSDRYYPSIIIISISKQGVSIIDPKNKEVLVMHEFSKITNWSSGSTYFHLTIGSLVKGNTLLCETSMGYRMDDLLSSYVNMYLTERTTVRPRNQMFAYS